MEKLKIVGQLLHGLMFVKISITFASFYSLDFVLLHTYPNERMKVCEIIFSL